jgi:hypothetical protein
MPDQYTEVTHNSWGSRIRKSTNNALIGLVLIPLCIWWLWTNEGKSDLSELAKGSVAVTSNTIDANKDGVFASISGRLSSKEQLGDVPYMVPNAYIALKRTAEMYAWEESIKTTETKDDVGGGATTTTTYTYDTIWTTSPQSSASFHFSDEHQNPSKSIDSAYFTVSDAHVGAYRIDPTTITLPEGQIVDVQSVENIADYGFTLANNTLYNGAPDSPRVGDIRLTYTALPNDIAVTVFGKINNGVIESYTDKPNQTIPRTLYRVFIGSREDAITLLREEYVSDLWTNRLLGILGLWIGLGLLTDPIIKILDVVAVVGNAAETVMRPVNAIVALTVGGATILISMVFHNIYLLIGMLVVVAIVASRYIQSYRDKAQAASNVPAPAVADANTSTENTSQS